MVGVNKGVGTNGLIPDSFIIHNNTQYRRRILGPGFHSHAFLFFREAFRDVEVVNVNVRVPVIIPVIYLSSLLYYYFLSTESKLQQFRIFLSNCMIEPSLSPGYEYDTR